MRETQSCFRRNRRLYGAVTGALNTRSNADGQLQRDVSVSSGEALQQSGWKTFLLGEYGLFLNR